MWIGFKLLTVPEEEQETFTTEQASAAYNSLKARLASANKRLESAQTTLSYSKIKAPFSSRVIDRFAEPGDLASPGMKILTLYDPSSLRVDANVRESLALTLTIGQSLETDIPALKRSTIATIEEIVPAANPGSRSFLIKAKIEHSDELLPGMFARIHIPSGEQQQLQLPITYIKQMGQLDVVWVLENKTAIRRFIRVGQQSGDHIVILSGLSAGDKIILPSQLETE
jgi:RND family efflux transporter MFP subunit